MKKITVSVATAAYNEQASIKQMLESVGAQAQFRIEIKEIIVISDGSSDSTVKIAKSCSLKDKRIKVIDDGKRLGQPARIGQIFKLFESDYLVLLDSDMLMDDEWVIERMILEFVKDPQVVFVAAHAKPLPAQTLIERAINNYRFARELLEDEYSFNNTAYGAHGCLAYRRDFAKKIVVPADIMSVDSYSYMLCKSKGYEFAHAKDAVVWYRSPQTIKDQINQASRHFAGGAQLHKYFKQEIIQQGFYTPPEILLKMMFIQLFKDPFAYLILKIVNGYCVYKSHSKLQSFSNTWTVIGSSKVLEVKSR